MPLDLGTALGPYRIDAPLGAGGMGEVYKATDTRLDRPVAIKVLPAELAADPARRERFEREAKTISSLQHPHICTLYDVGHQDGIDFLVMEHLEGETLEDRLTKGTLPLDQALRYAIEIADALDKAHRQGIVHRDLKPGNIMLTKAGAKLLDFGLAKLRGPAEAASGLSALPTQEANLTAEGTIVGTFQYMAPEQLEGSETDHRTDIWAFGCVVYEMVTGQKAFEGKSQASLIHAIMGVEPAPVSSVVPVAPPSLDYAVRTCLAKEPDDRWQTARDLLRELKRTDSGTSTARDAPAARSELRRPAMWQRPVPLLVGMSVLIVLGWLLGRSQPTSRPVDSASVTRFSIVLPTDVRLTTAWLRQVAVSPDGSRIAYVANDQLFVHRLREGTATPIPGTLGAGGPFFSPDGLWIGYRQAGGLFRVSTVGGTPISLGPVVGGFAAHWATDDTIFVTSSAGVARIPTSGGEGELIIVADPQERLRSPQFLVEHNAMIITTLAGGDLSNEGQVAIQWLETGERQVIVANGLDGRYLSTGHLIYWQGGQLFAARFNPAQPQVIEGAIPLVDGVSTGRGGGMHVGISATGTLVFVAGYSEGNRSLVWVDRSGRQERIDVEPRPFDYPRLSPDGTKLALSSRGDNGDIQILDLESRTLRRLTFDQAEDGHPLWHPDGTRVIFGSARDDGTEAVFVRAANGTGVAERLSPENDVMPLAVSPDGEHVLYMKSGSTGWDIGTMSRSNGWDGRLLLRDPFSETDPAISPDGKWVAYDSNESGRSEIYVRPFPNVEDGKWQISQEGGRNPAWSPQGGELFFRSEQGLWAVRYDTNPSFTHDTPERLFGDRFANLGGGRSWDPSSNGQRFVMLVDGQEADDVALMGLDRLDVVLNWYQELLERVPVP